MKKTLISLGLIIGFTGIGFLIKDYFLNLSFSLLETQNTQIVYKTLSGQFQSHLLFSLSIGIIPLLYLVIKKVTQLKFQNQGLITLVIILGCGILSWLFRIFQLNDQIQKLSKFNLRNSIQSTIDFQSLSLDIYLFVGFLIGDTISILIFKSKN
jgi:hypothetical protein